MSGSDANVRKLKSLMAMARAKRAGISRPQIALTADDKAAIAAFIAAGKVTTLPAVTLEMTSATIPAEGRQIIAAYYAAQEAPQFTDHQGRAERGKIANRREVKQQLQAKARAASKETTTDAD